MIKQDMGEKKRLELDGEYSLKAKVNSELPGSQVLKT